MINFIKHRTIFFTISLSLVLPSLVALLIFGLKPNIDFTGGSLLTVEISDAQQAVNGQVISQVLNPIYQPESVQSSEQNLYVIRGPEIDQQRKQQILTELQQHYAQVQEVQFESVGPVLGKELVIKTIVAVLLVSAVIIAYVWFQFEEVKFGICAILAMFHDSLILLGIFSLLGHFYGVEVDVLFVTALLTTLSFSIHDTIVIYDRIRELGQSRAGLSFAEIANLAILETLARSINNSVTIILMLAALVFLGGDSIRWFGVALLIGAIAGTYSSTFTAVPLLVQWHQWQQQKAG